MKLALFLDCYGVLYVRPIQLLTETYPEYSQELLDLYKSFSYGSISDGEFVDGVADLTEMTNDKVISLFSQNLALNQPLISEIKQSWTDKFDIYTFSNTSQDDLCRKCDTPELKALPVVAAYSSGLIGYSKPAEESFEAAAALAGVQGSDSVLVDDMTSNVEGARLVGWGSVLYTSTKEVIKNLEEIYNARVA